MTNSLATLTGPELFRELTLLEAAEWDDNPAPSAYDYRSLVAEIDKRFGPEALERVAVVITGGHYSPDDELRWIDTNPDSFMAVVRGDVTAFAKAQKERGPLGSLDPNVMKANGFRSLMVDVSDVKVGDVRVVGGIIIEVVPAESGKSVMLKDDGPLCGERLSVNRRIAVWRA